MARVLQTNLTGHGQYGHAPGAVDSQDRVRRDGPFFVDPGLRGDLQPQDGYAVSKAGIVALSKSLAIQLADENIRSNAVLPGYVDTPMNDFRWLAEVGQKEKASQLVPLKRIATPEDIANVCLFLLSDLANYVTGTEIIVDGGLTALPAVGA